MRTFLHIGLFSVLAPVLAVGGACRQSDSMDETMDMAQQAPDLAKPVKATTIRELNMTGGPIQVKDHVKFSGVVTSPMMWEAADDNPTGDDFCNYRIVLAHSDGSPPTLQDGMVVSVGLKTMFTGDMSKVAACDDLGKKSTTVMAMDGLKSGDLVEIQGTLQSFGQNGTRYVDAYGGKIAGMGPAAMQPMPVPVADPSMFAGGSPLPKAFVDASGALVRFDNVQVTAKPNTYGEYTVNTTAMGGASISSSYVRVLTKGYMAPPQGTMLKSVTGIVFGDYGGKVWPRTVDDIKM